MKLKASRILISHILLVLLKPPYFKTRSRALTRNAVDGICKKLGKVNNFSNSFSGQMKPAKFSNSVYLSWRNTQLWSQQNPHVFANRRNKHRFGFNIWCGILENHIIWSIIYNKNETGERCLHLLVNHTEEILVELLLVYIVSRDDAPSQS